ncbi:MAG: hypothetical protein V1682_07185 [Candidatus Omnitrophota bacterium]
MSIIQEALEKAQSDIKPAVQVPPGAPAPGKAEKTGKAVKPAAVLQKPPVLRIGSRKALIASAGIALGVMILLASGKILMMTSVSVDKPSAKYAQGVSYKPIVRGMAGEPEPARSAASSPELVLNGIMYVEGEPRAIVNNLIVQVGDSVSEAKVTGIKRDRVILEYANVEITLNLK